MSILCCFVGQIHFIHLGEEQSQSRACSCNREAADGSNLKEVLEDNGQWSLPEGLDKVEISELMEVNESLKNFDVEVIPAVQQEREDGYKRPKHREKEGRKTLQQTQHLSPR